MSWRDPEWLQRGLDALKATLDVAPSLKNEMIRFLITEGFWDGAKLSETGAVTKFNACMNPGKPEYFKLTEIWVLMKRFQRYELYIAMGEDLGFEPPKLIPRMIRREDLVERLEQLRAKADDETAVLLAQIDMLDAAEFAGPSSLDEEQRRLRVHPAMRERGVRFSLSQDDDGHAVGGF